jgi:lysyl-tRNA synthetase class 1
MFDKINSWPFLEARRVKAHIDAKGKMPGDLVTFETGYGPSGAPHIGTFGEVVRTLWVIRAFREITKDQYPTRLIMFSDDYDALRKVPDGLPEWMNDHLGQPLTQVPSPYEDKMLGSSFGMANNMKLIDFVDNILEVYNGGKVGHSPDRSPVSFVSSSEYYKAGKFNGMMNQVANKFSEIQDIMLPTLGKDRQATYSPFMPVIGGQVLQTANQPFAIGAHHRLQLLDPTSAFTTTGIYNGGVKLQWKADWAMRWVYFDVDYEMSGKDLIDSVKASSEICRALGGTPPVNLTYELFLDKEGAKISKSKGNGFTVEEWLTFGTAGSLMLFMFQNPRAAKKLYGEIVPQLEDQYLKLRAKEPEPQDAHWHFTQQIQDVFTSGISYTLLLNLAIVSQTRDPKELMAYLEQNRSLPEADRAYVERILPRVIRYADQHDLMSSQPREATLEEKLAFADLASRLGAMMPQQTAEEYQFQAYEVGKIHGYTNLREWFQALYECLLGTSDGPRFGALVKAFGLKNMLVRLRALGGLDV